MEFTCPLCKQSIEDATGCNIVHDDFTATLFHPHCYEQEVARQEAVQDAKLAARQAKERERIAAWNNLSKPSRS